MTARDNPPLKPCPFCGGKAHIHDPRLNPGGESWVSCRSCQASSITRSNPEAAIAAWNTRKEKPDAE